MTSNKNNKVEIKNRYNDKIKCEICEVVYTKCNKAHHEKTKRHQNAELKKKIEYIEMDEEEKEKMKKEEEKEKEKIKKNMIKQLNKLKAEMEKNMEKNMEKTMGKLTNKISSISEQI
jgi:hypothetical protein